MPQCEHRIHHPKVFASAAFLFCIARCSTRIWCETDIPMADLTGSESRPLPPSHLHETMLLCMGAPDVLKFPLSYQAQQDDPRYITPIRSDKYETTPRSCEMKRDVSLYFSCSSRIKFKICACTETSSAETGSSATIKEGFIKKASAMLTRWRCPPESSFGISVCILCIKPNFF